MANILKRLIPQISPKRITKTSSVTQLLMNTARSSTRLPNFRDVHCT